MFVVTCIYIHSTYIGMYILFIQGMYAHTVKDVKDMLRTIVI